MDAEAPALLTIPEPPRAALALLKPPAPPPLAQLKRRESAAPSCAGEIGALSSPALCRGSHARLRQLAVDTATWYTARVRASAR
jgi:hypothetical protein